MTRERRDADLDAAKALVLAGWTQGTPARDASGGKIGWERREAASFCLGGAICRAAAVGASISAVVVAVNGAIEALGLPRNIHLYNDAPGRTKEEVADLLERAKEQPYD